MHCRFLLFVCLLLTLSAGAQTPVPPLPDFQVTTVNKNKVVISWVNPHPKVVQLMVQRSADSLRYFRTIFNAPSPELPENGFTDNNTIGAKWYYKISYVLEGGAYFSTPSKRAGQQNAPAVVQTTRLIIPDSVKAQQAATPDLPVTVRLEGDSVLGVFYKKQFEAFRDSIIYRTYDTLVAVKTTEYFLRVYRGEQATGQSPYLFVNRDNFIQLSLPDAKTYQYRLVIFGPDNQPFIELKNIKDGELLLDKANFIHAGSYYFEVWRNGRILERNRLYLRKDF